MLVPSSCPQDIGISSRISGQEKDKVKEGLVPQDWISHSLEVPDHRAGEPRAQTMMGLWWVAWTAELWSHLLPSAYT